SGRGDAHRHLLEDAAAMMRVETDGALALLTLARADARNAIDPAWVTALGKAVSDCAGRDDVRGLLIRADGPAFTVGGDLAHFAAHIAELPAQLDAMIGAYHPTLQQLAELPFPVVCAAHGAVAGGGLGLLWAADVVVLADDVKLATGFARLGLSGD